jgi:hypothetical protein
MISLNALTPGKRALALTITALMLASGLDAQSRTFYSARDVNVRVETDRPTYGVGDSIRVRLTLRNGSAKPVRIPSVSPMSLIRLRVYDAAGNQVKLATSKSPAIDGGSDWPLGAGSDVILKDWHGHYWLNLRDWGYDLREPGRYSIVGIPWFVNPEITPDSETARAVLMIVP